MNSACGMCAAAQLRTCAQPWLWVATERIADSSMSRRPTSTKLIGTRISRRICSASPLAMSSRVALTPPSTEFSIGTTAKCAEPSRTWASAVITEPTGSHWAVSVPGTWRSAASVNVPSGPR
jgi:hypothetical protein